jgi:hypothetical protein
MAFPFDPMVMGRQQHYRQYQKGGKDNCDDERPQKAYSGVRATEASQYADQNVQNRFDHGG